jgi:hypothetical protein
MNGDGLDDLDRALFALPLEDPPPGLRRDILAATIYAPAEAPLFRAWEIGLIGGVLALGVWLILALAGDPRLGERLAAGAASVVRASVEPATLGWLAAGVLTALALSAANFTPPPSAQHSGRP